VFATASGRLVDKLRVLFRSLLCLLRCRWSPCRRSYRCDCVDGYRGRNCETADHCHGSPCRHGGTCVPLDAGYSCRCDIEFQGPDCRHETPCNGHGKRCYNDGVCRRRPAPLPGDDAASEPSPDETSDQRAEFYCDCQPGYSGARCQDFDPCSSGNACVNGGTCQVEQLIFIYSSHSMCLRCALL